NIQKNSCRALAASVLLFATANWSYSADPAAAAVHGNKGNDLAQAAKYDEAIVEFTKAIELSPADSRLYNDRGRVSRAMAKYEDAIKDYSASIEKKPDNPLTFNRRADSYYATGQYPQALADLEAALKLKPDDFDTNQKLQVVKAKMAPPKPVVQASAPPPTPA